jgi:hypothetical protein
MKRKAVGALLGFSALIAILLLQAVPRIDTSRDSNPLPASSVIVPADPLLSELTAGERRRSNDSQAGSANDSLIAVIDSDNDTDGQSDTLERTARNLSPSEFPSALHDLLGKNSAAASLLRQFLVRRWAEQDPHSAADWVIQHLDNEAYTEAVAQVALAWAGVEPAAAASWANSLPENPAKQQALLNIGYELAGTQPSVVLGIVSNLAPGADRDNLLFHAFSQWGSIDSQAASVWIQQIHDDSLRQRLQSELAVSLADKDEAGAGALAANLAPGPDQDRAVVEIVQRWVQTAPTSAGAWVASFPDTPLRQSALEALVAVWKVQDSASAASWVDHLAPGPLRDAGLMVLSGAGLGLPR